MMTMAKKVRADRSQNRTDILNAAKAVFAEQGFDTPLAVLAARAGVSRMTLSRHFPDRESLGFALFERNVEELQENAIEWSKRADGYFLFLESLIKLYAENIGLAQALSRKASNMKQLDELRRRVSAISSPLLATAKGAGAIRPDVGDDDLYLIMDMFDGAIGEFGLEKRKKRAMRALDLLLGALRLSG